MRASSPVAAALVFGARSPYLETHAQGNQN